MAKFELKFLDCSSNKSYIKVDSEDNTIFITGLDSEGINEDGDDSENQFSIWLDKSTAIKFAKTLRTEINKIQS